MLACPKCEDPIGLRVTHTANVPDYYARTIRMRCANPKCKAVFTSVQVVYREVVRNGLGYTSLAKSMLNGTVRVLVDHPQITDSDDASPEDHEGAEALFDEAESA
jgi:hypothetical protein